MARGRKDSDKLPKTCHFIAWNMGLSRRFNGGGAFREFFIRVLLPKKPSATFRSGLADTRESCPMLQPWSQRVDKIYWFQRFDGSGTPRCPEQMGVHIKPPNLGSRAIYPETTVAQMPHLSTPLAQVQVVACHQTPCLPSLPSARHMIRGNSKSCSVSSVEQKEGREGPRCLWGGDYGRYPGAMTHERRFCRITVFWSAIRTVYRSCNLVL